MNQFTFSKTSSKQGDLSRYDVLVDGNVIGQVYKFRKDYRDVWQYEGTAFPHHLFRNRFDAACKLHSRMTRPCPVFS